MIPAVPSTLDLYAVHLLAGGLKERTIVTLPSHIPYMAFPGFVGPTVTGSSVVSATTTRTEASVRTETVGVQFGWNTPLMAIVAVVAILALGVFLAYRARLRGKAPAPAIQSQIARRYCPNCGAEISADAKFCMNCGVSGT